MSKIEKLIKSIKEAKVIVTKSVSFEERYGEPVFSYHYMNYFYRIGNTWKVRYYVKERNICMGEEGPYEFNAETISDMDDVIDEIVDYVVSDWAVIKIDYRTIKEDEEA